MQQQATIMKYEKGADEKQKHIATKHQQITKAHNNEVPMSNEST
jgi:hypothetical protein